MKKREKFKACRVLAYRSVTCGGWHGFEPNTAAHKAQINDAPEVYHEGMLVPMNAWARIRTALSLWNKMEHRVANCEAHEESDSAPENCEKCFPHCDKARLSLRDACTELGIKLR